MAENSNIEWTDHTFNPWIGCTKVSPACKNCYAERDFDHRLQKAKWGDRGTRRVTSAANWNKVWRWDEAAESEGVRRRVFCASLADVFEDWKGVMHGPNGEVVQVAENGMITFGTDGVRVATMADVRRDLFRMIDATPNLDWLLLTKRPENIAWMIDEMDGRLFETQKRSNVWLGTSVENQEWAVKRVPRLMNSGRYAAKLFLSCEPLVGSVDLSIIQDDHTGMEVGPFDASWKVIGDPDPHGLGATFDKIDWVIAGGESGPGARPSHPDWFRSLRDQCERAGTPFHFKQWGEWLDKSQPSYEGQPFGDNFGLLTADGRWGHTVADSHPAIDEAVMVRVGKKKTGRLLDGIQHDGVPYAINTEVSS